MTTICSCLTLPPFRISAYVIQGIYFDGLLQNVKGVFDAAIKVVLQPPKSKKKKKKSQGVCSVL